MNWKDWNLDNKDKYYLIALFFISMLSFLRMMDYSLSGCISNPDIALYLLSGLKYAGLDNFNVVNPNDLYYTPVISFLSSLFFRIGYVDKNAIIFVTSLFSFFGYFGFYLLLRNKFNSLLSLTGVIIFGCFPLMIVNIARGMIDVPAISVSIWALVFAIMAIDKNPKYFLISFPLLAVGFFIKYVVGFTLPLIFLYYVMRRNFIFELDEIISDKSLFKDKIKNYIKSKEFKYLFASIIISIIIAGVICKTLILDFGGQFLFFKQSSTILNSQVHSNPSSIIDFNIDKSYYFDHFSDILFLSRRFNSLFTGILYGIFGVGVLISIFKFKNHLNKFKSEKNSFKTKYFEKLLYISCLILIAMSLFSFKYLSNHMLSNICLLIFLTLSFAILQQYKIKERVVSLDILFIAYFLVYFVFLSAYIIKVPRYALPFIPPFVYLVIWGLNSIANALDDKKMKFNLGQAIPMVVLILFFIVTISVLIAPMDYDDSNEVYRDVYAHDFENDLVEACNFIIENDPDYHNKTFSSNYHNSRIIRWYLNVNLTIMDEDVSLKHYDETDYVIHNQNRSLINYNKNDFGRFHVYNKYV